jgi:hypothetical protein
MLISLVKASDLENMIDTLTALRDAGRLRSLRINQRNDGSVAFKINEGMWTHSMGTIDPQSDLAYRRALDKTEQERASGRIRTLIDPETGVRLDEEEFVSP